MVDDIILFVQLINYGSMSFMAKHLAIAQSTISRKISSLEKQLGFELLIRDNVGLKLTEKGQIFFDSFKDIEQEIQKRMSPVLVKKKQISGILKLLLPPAFSQYAISPYLGEFCQKHPELHLECYYKYHNINMRKENYDIAIISYIPNQLTQKVKAIYASKIIPVYTKEYIQRYGRFEKLEDINNHLIVGGLFGDEAKVKSVLLYEEKTDKAIEVNQADRLMVNNFMQGMSIMKEGHAICCLPEDSVKSGLASGEIIRALPDYYLGYMTFYMLRNIDETDLRFKVFNEFIKSCMNKLKHEWEFEL